MTLSERPPRKRDRRERLPYDQLFDGRSWLLETKDYGGRSQVKIYNLIRQAAWRRGLKVAVEFDEKKLIVQAAVAAKK
jgi:transposase